MDLMCQAFDELQLKRCVGNRNNPTPIEIPSTSTNNFPQRVVSQLFKNVFCVEKSICYINHVYFMLKILFFIKNLLTI
jgi:hypothetical protein